MMERREMAMESQRGRVKEGEEMAMESQGGRERVKERRVKQWL